MNVLHYARRIVLEEGGVVRAVLDMAAAMARNGHTVTLATPEPTDIPDEWRASAAGRPRALDLPPVRSRLDLLSKRALADLEAAIAECDVLHLHGPWVTSNIQAAKIARRLGTPYVLSTHGVFNAWALAHRGWKKKIYLGLVGRKLLEGAGAVHCTADAELDAASAAFPNGRGAVVPLIFDAEPYTHLPGPAAAIEKFPELTGDDPVVLFLGRVAPIKRVELLVEAFAAVAKENPAARLVIAGVFEDPAYQQQLAEQARLLGVFDRTTFAGHVGGDLKLSLYERAAVTVLPSYQENFGIVLFESLACRTPVIATKGVNSWKLLAECRQAEVIDPAEPAELARAIASTLGNGRSDTGREWVFDRMGEPALCAEYAAMYREAGAGG